MLFNNLKANDCSLFLNELLFELKMGHGLQEAIVHMDSRFQNENLQKLITHLNQSLQLESVEESFRNVSSATEDKNFQLALRLIGKLHYNVAQLILGLESLSMALEKIILFDLEQKTALASSTYQAVFIAGLSLGMSILGPLLFPGVLVSFIDLQMSFHYVFGILLILSGIYLLCRSSWKLKRKRKKIMSSFCFLQCLVSNLEIGQNFLEAWNSALDFGFMEFGERLKLDLGKFDLLAALMNERLKSFDGPCRSVLERMIYQIHHVSLLPKQLKLAIQMEFDREFEKSRFQIKKQSVMSLLPVLLLCFPGCCYMLIGPQLMRALLELRMAG